MDHLGELIDQILKSLVVPTEPLVVCAGPRRLLALDGFSVDDPPLMSLRKKAAENICLFVRCRNEFIEEKLEAFVD